VAYIGTSFSRTPRGFEVARKNFVLVRNEPFQPNPSWV